MKECSICYEICKNCSDRLLSPTCPFCRSHIVGLTTTKENLDSFSTYYENYRLLSVVDDMYFTSRWYRRQIRRLKRSRDHETNRENNRIISRNIQECRRECQELNRREQRRKRKNFIRNLLYDISH